MRKEYTTKNRSSILGFIKDNKDKTVSALDIINYMKSIGSNINQTTVYRYLDKLCSQQIIAKYPDNSGEKCVYQFLDDESGCENHLHLKCTECGKLIHMDCPFIEEFSKHVKKDHNFDIQFKGNMLYGLCDECKNNHNKKK